MVTDGRTGFLVPPADAGALANAIGRLLESEPLRRQMGELGRLDAQAFSLDRYVARLTQIYGALAAGRSLRTAEVPPFTPPRSAPPVTSTR